MLTLYHGDTAVCAAKVRVTLFEKQLAWEGKLLDLQKGDQFRAEYVALNRDAVVPTLIHDGVVVTQSTVINEYLDEAFVDRPLRPADPPAELRSGFGRSAKIQFTTPSTP